MAIADENTGEQLFAATMTGPVDQKVTLVEGNAIQTVYDPMAEGC